MSLRVEIEISTGQNTELGKPLIYRETNRGTNFKSP